MKACLCYPLCSRSWTATETRTDPGLPKAWCRWGLLHIPMVESFRQHKDESRLCYPLQPEHPTDWADEQEVKPNNKPEPLLSRRGDTNLLGKVVHQFTIRIPEHRRNCCLRGAYLNCHITINFIKPRGRRLSSSWHNRGLWGLPKGTCYSKEFYLFEFGHSHSSSM